MVPRGIVLIGVPRAQDAMERVGDQGMSLEKALGQMGTLVEGAAA